MTSIAGPACFFAGLNCPKIFIQPFLYPNHGNRTGISLVDIFELSVKIPRVFPHKVVSFCNIHSGLGTWRILGLCFSPQSEFWSIVCMWICLRSEFLLVDLRYLLFPHQAMVCYYQSSDQSFGIPPWIGKVASDGLVSKNRALEFRKFGQNSWNFYCEFFCLIPET